MKKKIVAVIIAAIGILLAVFGVIAKKREAATIGIIGGADGPTAIFVAGKIDGGGIAGILLILAGLVIAGILICRLFGKK